MNQLYESIGMTKQGFHQGMDRWLKARSEQGQLLLWIYRIREDHPTMGLRDMYHRIRPGFMGRDAFERFCREVGLSSELPKNWARTTDSSGVVRFENLLTDLVVDRINQVWQSDITYFEVSGRFYYITFIIDGFSRLIVGYSVSKRLLTEQTTLPALKMAINNRIRQGSPMELCRLIFHSDGGGQFYAREFLQLTNKYGIMNSMCVAAWENGKAERINGVIKNNYLKHRGINNFDQLNGHVDRSVYLYNTEKPHIGLQRRSPVEFEKQYICNAHNVKDNQSKKEIVTQTVTNNKQKAVNVI